MSSVVSELRLPAEVQSLQVSATLPSTHPDSSFQDSHSNHKRKCLLVILDQSLIFYQQAGRKPECPAAMHHLLSLSSCSVLLSLHGATHTSKDRSAPSTTGKAVEAHVRACFQ